MRPKLLLAVLLIFSVLFAGSCASTKKSTPRSQAKNLPKAADPEPEFKYEFDVVVAVDPEEQQASRPDYEDTSKPRPQPKPDEPPAPAFYESIYVPVSESASGKESSAAKQQESQEEAAQIAQQRQQTQQQASPGAVLVPAPEMPPSSIRGSAANRNTNLSALGSVSTEGVTDYIKSRNKTPVLSEANTRKLINLYLNEAAKEDVNYDFAIAQMLYWTAFLTDKQRMGTNNYAGLQPTKEWDGKFSTMEEGVQAHIQHLRGYSHPTLKDTGTKIIDPRWNQISNFRGTVKSFDQLYPRWTQNTERYKKNINIILNDMYQYSDKIR